MVHTWKTHRTKDISTSGQIIRCVCAIVWIIYASIYFDIDIIISWLITMFSSLWTLYYKARYEYQLRYFSMGDIEMIDV